MSATPMDEAMERGSGWGQRAGRQGARKTRPALGVEKFCCGRVGGAGAVCVHTGAGGADGRREGPKACLASSVKGPVHSAEEVELSSMGLGRLNIQMDNAGPKRTVKLPIGSGSNLPEKPNHSLCSNLATKVNVSFPIFCPCFQFRTKHIKSTSNHGPPAPHQPPPTRTHLGVLLWLPVNFPTPLPASEFWL